MVAREYACCRENVCRRVALVCGKVAASPPQDIQILLGGWPFAKSAKHARGHRTADPELHKRAKVAAK